MKRILIAIIASSFLIAGYTLASKRTVQGEKPQNVSAEIRYAAAEGKVEAMPGFDVEVGSELTGRIKSFLVKERDLIKKGDLIATIDNGDILAKLKETERELAVARTRLKEVASGAREEEVKKATAEHNGAVAEMELAKANLERYRQLYSRGIVSKSELDEKERNFKVASAKVEGAFEEKKLLEKGPKQETLKLHEDIILRAEAAVEYQRKLLEKTVIKAPISGKVIHKFIEEGEMVNPDKPLVAIADFEKIWIKTEFDETDMNRVHLGDPVDITTDAYPGKVFKGVVKEISDYVGNRNIRPNNTGKNLDIKVLQANISVDDKKPFKLGMTVDVKITLP